MRIARFPTFSSCPADLAPSVWSDPDAEVGLFGYSMAHAALRALTEGLEPANAPSVETFDFPFDCTREQRFLLAGRFRNAVEAVGRLIIRFADDHLS